MSELELHSSLAVQPEIVLGHNEPEQKSLPGLKPVFPLAPYAIPNNNELLVQWLAESVVRLCVAKPLTASFAVTDAEPITEQARGGKVQWLHQGDGQWSFTTAEGQTLLQTSRGYWRDEAGWLHLYLACEPHWSVYGLGEKTGGLNKRGRRWQFWNSDVFDAHTEGTDELYQSIPFLMVNTGQGWLGLLLDNPGRTRFDLRAELEFCLSVERGALDIYLMQGDSPAEILDQYTQLTGRPFLPPMWSLGYHQSRHSYESSTEIREVVAAFRHHDLPLDALYLDIRYMQGYRVFTFDQDRFGDAAALIADMSQQGIRTVPIVDPGIKVDTAFEPYHQGCEAGYFAMTPLGAPWRGQVWPGETVWPDFFQPEVVSWWQGLHRFYTDLGIEGIWNDMNEPAVFNERKTMDADVLHRVEGKPVEHEGLHNAYGLLMSEATAKGLPQLTGHRPFVLTRAGYAGIQRSSAVWTGDNRSYWEHLRMSVPMLLNMGLSGVPFCGADVGGFMDNSEGELLTRWMQLSAFYPFMRNHCSIGLAPQEPWQFGDTWLPPIRRAMQRRYHLLPLLYQLFVESHRSGAPIMRPLFWADPQHPVSRRCEDEFLIGDDLLVAPINATAQWARSVWLPKGDWVSVWDNRLLSGHSHCLAETGYDDIPVFVRAGSMLMLAPARRRTAEPLKELRCLIVEGGDQAELHYQDDDGLTQAVASGAMAELNLGYKVENDQVQLRAELNEMAYRPEWRTLVLGLPESWRGRDLTVSGQAISPEQGVRLNGGRLIECRFVAPRDWI